MSVIENPLAYLNETSEEQYDEETPVCKRVSRKKMMSSESDILDETPLTSSNRTKSPRQLNNQIHAAAGDPSENTTPSDKEVSNPENSSKTDFNPSSVMEGGIIANPSATKLAELETSPKEVGGKDSTQSKPGTDFLKLAEQLHSDEEDDEYVPGADKKEEGEEEEEEEVEGEVKRQYTLRDGVKGTAEDTTKIVSDTDSDKKRGDDLWSAFKADVAMPIKRKAKEMETTLKTYDFAGEVVTVKEEIRNKRKSIASTLGFTDRKRRRESAPLSLRSHSGETGSNSSEEPTGSVQPAKRARPVSKLNSLVSRLTKKPKLTVLNKTMLDWKEFKDDKGITDDVKNEAKDEGYLEKQEFLARTDQRQYEIEKEIRMQQQRRRQFMNSKQFG